MMRAITGLILVTLGAACGGGGTTPPGDDNPPGDDVQTYDASPPDAPPAKRVRFIALGDAGKGDAGQRAVAVAARDVCAAKGCDFALMLGDNIYDSGVTSVTSEEWQTKFEQPYHDLDLPFYVALGNHDYGGNIIIPVPGVGNEFEKGQIEVDYTAISTKWTLPATHYTFSFAHVGFIVLDTNSILWSNTMYGDQATWLPTAIAEVADRDWKIVVGHHPYRSNGTHGNAGNYDAPEIFGIPIPNPLPIQNGTALKDFFDANVCGIGQIYFAGHDHARQWLDEPDALCGTEMIVNGAGASVTNLVDRGNVTFYEDATEPGFMYVDIDGDSFTGTYYDADGNVDFTRTFTRP